MIRPMRAAALPLSLRFPALSRALLRLLSPPVLLILAMAALVLVVRPGGEFPVDDDWDHARVVRTLVEQGRFEISARADVSLVLQAYWGALFARLFGFSFTALRVSTLVLGGLGVLGCYALLRELLDSRRALLGALALLFNPLYVFLSYSFMSDVPFLNLALWALFCYARALRGSRPHLGWIAAGSALAGGAFLVRQLGAALPLAALGGLLLSRGWRAALRPRHLTAAIGPFLPAALLWAYLDALRPAVKPEPLGWTLAFWMENGPGLVGVVLSRLAAMFSTVGLFALPLSLGALAARPALRLERGRWWLAGGLLLALVVGFVVRKSIFGLSPLLPHLGNVLTARGFFVSNAYYGGTLPRSIIVPEPALVAATGAALLGGGLLALAVSAALSRETVRGPAAVPLLFGLLALGLTVLYHAFYDRYLLTLLPSALLLALLLARLAGPSRALALTGAALLAAWSIWWERDYLDRRAALWQAGQILVERGVPPEQIDGGFEWNGWYRGEAIIAAGLRRRSADGTGRGLEEYILQNLHLRGARWVLEYAPPAPGGSVVATVSYGRGQRVVAVQRF